MTHWAGLHWLSENQNKLNPNQCHYTLITYPYQRRRRRSATPVKIGGITMGDQATEQSVLFSSFFICEPASNSIAGYVKALPLDLGSFNFANMIVHMVEIGFIIGQYYLILSHLQNWSPPGNTKSSFIGSIDQVGRRDVKGSPPIVGSYIDPIQNRRRDLVWVGLP